MNVKATPFNSFAFVSMAALAISGGSLVACQLQPAFQTKDAPTLLHLKLNQVLTAC
ncbi:hypothetical protein BANRA_01327 [Acinetobacter baumannii]|nr:hypothetical protein BANRA_01327 [Acinetobacter baumannii]